MGAETGIGWTDHTFNPWWGCVRVSPGCEHCYAESWDARFGKIFDPGKTITRAVFGGELKDAEHWGPKAPRRFFGEKHWSDPVRWNKACEKLHRREKVFCSSMADVFEPRDDLGPWRLKLWGLIERTPSLDWQLLTKRPERARYMLPEAWMLNPLPNVWIGTSVEDQRRAQERIPELLKIPAAVRFLSVEPLLEAVDLSWYLGELPEDDDGAPYPGKLHWVIVGGESGAHARPMRLEWARAVLDQCRNAGVAVYMKQLGSKPESWSGRLHLPGKGDEPEHWPPDLRVQDFPVGA